MDLHERMSCLQRPDHNRTIGVAGGVVTWRIIIDTQHITFLQRSQQVRLRLASQIETMWTCLRVNKLGHTIKIITNLLLICARVILLWTALETLTKLVHKMRCNSRNINRKQLYIQSWCREWSWDILLSIWFCNQKVKGQGYRVTQCKIYWRRPSRVLYRVPSL